MRSSLAFDMVMAARWGGYAIHEFHQLDTDWQAHIVAAYQCDCQANAVIQQDIERKRAEAQAAANNKAKA